MTLLVNVPQIAGLGRNGTTEAPRGPGRGHRYGKLAGVDWRIRRYRPSDEEAIVELSLRAWAPVFASLEEVLGVEIFRRLHPDWRVDQGKAVRTVLLGPATEIWVADAETGPTGFVAVTLDAESLIGEVHMLAVDPETQDQGVGTALTELATDWLRTSGMRIAMIDTGGDPGHAPARRVYEKANYALLPVARYFKAL
jgi:GNAT superfamily N-acetyltransferase